MNEERKVWRNPKVMLAVSIVIALSIIAFVWRQSPSDEGTTTGGLEPSPLRQSVLEQIKGESVDELFDKLTEKLDDIAYTVTGSGLGFDSSEGTYKFAVVVPRLARVRKILQELQEVPHKPSAKLKKMLVEAADGFEQLTKDVTRQAQEYLSKKSPSSPVVKRDIERKKVMEAHVATYLLAEWSCCDALPIMVRVYDQEGRLPVPRLYLFYAMHLLATSHPQDSLSPDSKAALDKYLQATKDHVPAPHVFEFATWDSPNDELDLRRSLLRKDRAGANKKGPTIRIRQYPVWFREYEDNYGDSKKRHEYRNYLATEVHQWYAMLKEFVAKTQ